MKVYKTTIVFIILNLLIIIGIILIAFPLKKTIINSLGNSKITNALYGADDIWKETVKINKIAFDSEIGEVKEEKSSMNEYEKAILTKSDGNENYKLINLKVDGMAAYMAVIYDPTKVQLIHAKKFNTSNSSGAETIMSMCKRYGGTVCINGGKFEDYGVGSDIPKGYLIDDGKVIWPANGKDTTIGQIIGFTKEGKLKLLKTTAKVAIEEEGIVDALQFGPFLIQDGKEIVLKEYDIGGYLKASRVAIAQRADGIVLFLVADGLHGSGATIKSMTKTLLQYGAVTAANLDGGASSQLIVKGKLINNPVNIYGQSLAPGRSVVSGFGVIFDK